MTAFSVVRRIGLVLAAVVVGVSGVYVVIDLARWEWNRALLSGMVFISALIVLVAMLLFRQMQRLEQRMAALEQPPNAASSALTTIHAGNRAHAATRFRWLEPVPDRLGVFIPVLLGAGAMLSFLAYVIERVAGAFAATTLDRRTVSALAPDLPLGSGVVAPATAGTSPDAPVRPAVRITIAVLTAVLALVLVQSLRALTQSRPDEVVAAGTSTVVLEVTQSRHIRPVTAAATDLWSSCRSRIPGPIEVTSMTPLGGDRVQLELDRALGRTGRARLTGCLEDYTLDLMRADVVSVLVVRPLERDDTETAARWRAGGGDGDRGPTS